jgi:hypothetical protein
MAVRERENCLSKDVMATAKKLLDDNVSASMKKHRHTTATAWPVRDRSGAIV